MTYKEKIEAERQAVADLLIAEIERGKLEWSKGWHAVNSCPNNAKTGREYSGTNFVILYLTALKSGYSDMRWLTFNQAKELGASVKKGEKATSIFYWSEYDSSTKKAPNWDEINKLPKDERRKYCDENIRFGVKYYNVFNAEQCANMPKFEPIQMSEEERTKQNELIEKVISNSAAPIVYGGGRAYYNHKEDKIYLPQVSDFKSMQNYYATALHEIAHSTGHKSRLGRDFSDDSDEAYALEELRAELASMFLQSELGITIDGAHFENHGAYVQFWLKRLKNDKNVLFTALKDAGDIATFIKENFAQLTKGVSERIIQPENKPETVRLRMTARESEIFEDFVRAFKDDARNNRLEILDFGADRPQSADFWQGLAYLGKVGISPTGYSVEFERNRSLGNFEYIDALPDSAGKSDDEREAATLSPQMLRYRKDTAERLDAIERNTPPEMKALPHWCAYKTHYDKTAKKFDKFVVNCNPGEEMGKWAKFNEPATWTTFENALEYARRNNCAGLSFAIKDTGINCIDLDNCYVSGEYNDVADSILKELKESAYIEQSRSGHGLHVFLKDNILENGKYKNRNLPIKPTVEIFEDWGFISMTGKKISKTNNLSACPQELKKYLQNAVGEKAERKPVVAYINNVSDRDVIERIRRSKKGKEFEKLFNGESMFFKPGGEPDNSRNDFALLNMLAFFTNGDANQMERIFRTSGLYRESKGDKYLRLSIDNAIGTLCAKRKNVGEKFSKGKQESFR